MLLTWTSSAAQPVAFNAPQDFAVAKNPSFVVVGDFNGDRKLDLAVANKDAGTISIMLGTATGHFARHMMLLWL